MKFALWQKNRGRLKLPRVAVDMSSANTFHLRRYFSIASGILMLAVILPLAYAYYYSEVAEHTMLAGLRNETLARTYANTLWPDFGAFLMRKDLTIAERKSHPLTFALDKRIREMSHEAPVLKIKVYNLDGIAVYSSVLKEIGEDKSQNSGFVNARSDVLVNDLTHRGKMSATEGEVGNVDVVSTYIPIHLATGKKVEAVFELYSNITESVSHIETITIRLLFGLIAVFLCLYLSLLIIVGRADKIIKRQYESLRENGARLEHKTEELEHEIRERREIELALRQSEDVAARANQAKSEFLAAMSHELRTPMNSILGFTQLLETEPDAPLHENQRRFTKQIMKAGAHLLGLIDQVLDLSRIESGKLALSMEPVRVKALVEEVLPMVQHLATQKQLAAFKIEFEDMAVIADYGRLKQVLLNLLSNAIKYNRQGGSITLTTRLDRGCVQLSISDTGMGIPDARLSELFQPFSRLGVQSADVEGTGIGLAVSKRMIEAMGGTIGVSSTEGVGSRFWIALAVAPDQPGTSASATAAETSSELTPASDSLHTRSILYIEDNPANVLLLEELIRRIPGVQLTSAHTAELGIALATQSQPDLVIMDINLPGMDGFQALAQLKGSSITAHIPVIALTANAMPSTVERGRTAGFFSYHTKPINLETMTQAIFAAMAGAKDADV